MNNKEIEIKIEKGKVKRLQKEALEIEKKKKEALDSINYRRFQDQHRIILHLSRYGYSSYLLMGILLITLLVLGIIGNTIGRVWLISIPFGLSLVFFLKKQLIKWRLKNEYYWIKNIPFQLVAYPDLFVYRSYPSFRFSIEFVNKKPKEDVLLNLLSNLPYDIFKQSDSVFCYEVHNKKASKFNLHRRWAYNWIHQAIDNELKWIHANYPIKKIIFGDGKLELDFDWWISIKPTKWYQFT